MLRHIHCIAALCIDCREREKLQSHSRPGRVGSQGRSVHDGAGGKSTLPHRQDEQRAQQLPDHIALCQIKSVAYAEAGVHRHQP